MGNVWQASSTLIGSGLLGAIAVFAVPQVSFAQNLPICTSPDAAEYLVLVFTPSEPLQEEVRVQAGRTLPQNQVPLVCEYGGNVLSRVGGFDSLASATKWAEYFDTAVGLPLMVIMPETAATAHTAIANPPTSPVKETVPPPDLLVDTEVEPLPTVLPLATTRKKPPSFQPQALGGGYGILVDYGSNPAIATQLKTLLAKDIGLVVYAAHGYLLAEQTEDSNRVTELLNLINKNGLTAIAVSADQLILLRANVTP